MLKVVNRILFFSKIIILLFDFSLTLYIMLMLNSSREGELLNLFLTCIPIFLTLVIFVISFFFHKGTDNVIFNSCSLLALIAIFIIDFRTLFDQNMVMWVKDNINFYFFRNNVSLIKMLCYMIFIGNIILINNDYIKEKTKVI